MRITKCLLVTGLIFLTSCSKPNSPILPVVSGNYVSQNRTTGTSTIEFVISLDKKSSADVSFQYATLPGTAEADKDFSPVSGVLTIPAGSQTGSIKVTITGDSTRKANQDFSIELSDPKNCTIQTSHIKATIINGDGLYFPVDNTGYTTPNQYNGYTLVWSDEFSGKSINQSYWSFESGNNNGWGNHELEYYTGRTQNAFVS